MTVDICMLYIEPILWVYPGSLDSGFSLESSPSCTYLQATVSRLLCIDARAVNGPGP